MSSPAETKEGNLNFENDDACVFTRDRLQNTR